MFIDRAVINVYGGVGGSGSEAMRREKGVPRGGPAGGDGGAGGSVVLVADSQLGTLMDLRYRQHYRAKRGLHGEGNNKTGRSGADLVVRVPPGTLVRNAESGELLGELLADSERLVVAKGGRGGRGNIHFTTDTRQAPRHWEPGEDGEELRIELELKLIADIGLVGEPNAGKSTLLSVISEAQPKIADYPFTTVSPNLGVVKLTDFRSFVVADIPGIIEGAHEGKGLGHQFLKHIERTRSLAFMIPFDAEDRQAEYETLRSEISSYSEELAARPHCVVITKADLVPAGEAPPSIVAPDAWGSYLISSVTRAGVAELLEGLWTRAQEALAEERDGEDEWWKP